MMFYLDNHNLHVIQNIA